jgi:hypothetical protein
MTSGIDSDDIDLKRRMLEYNFRENSIKSFSKKNGLCELFVKSKLNQWNIPYCSHKKNDYKHDKCECRYYCYRLDRDEDYYESDDYGKYSVGVNNTKYLLLFKSILIFLILICNISIYIHILYIYPDQKKDNCKLLTSVMHHRHRC